jgi:hypothetical protein
MLVFLASMTNASAQSSRKVSCLSAAAFFTCWIRSSEYLRPYQ